MATSKGFARRVPAWLVLAAALVAAPAPRSVAAPAPPPDPERAAALAVLESYRQAMEARDLEALIAVWPALGEEKGKGRQVAMSFELTAALRLEIEVLEVTVEGPRAVVRCRRHDAIRLTNGQDFENESGAIFRLRRGDAGGWWIEDIEEADL